VKKWQDPSLTLGERCVAFGENELANGVAEDRKGSYTSPRLREYFAICTRIINGKEVNLNFKAGNWCSAGVSFSLYESLLPGETKPHGYRLGVVEVVADCQKAGLWHSTADVKAGKYSIRKGDIIIFDRSTPGKPETAWYRHIGRVQEVGANGSFKCISGNSGGQWRISNHTLNQANLLGFCAYPSDAPRSTPMTPTDWSNIDILSLNPNEDTGKDLEVDNFFSLYSDLFGKKS